MFKYLFSGVYGSNLITKNPEQTKTGILMKLTENLVIIASSLWIRYWIKIYIYLNIYTDTTLFLPVGIRSHFDGFHCYLIFFWHHTCICWILLSCTLHCCLYKYHHVFYIFLQKQCLLFCNFLCLVFKCPFRNACF